MIHEWWGLNQNIKDMAETLAKEGYVVLAVDLYNGQVANTPDTAQNLVSKVRDNPSESINNLQHAVRYLASLENVNSSKIASLGWCFGGGQSLQLALNTEPEYPLAATVIYYGNLVSDQESLSKIKWPVLGIFGDQDQSISVESVKQFEDALNANGITNEIYIYKGVGHAFANPSGDNYAPKETQDAWEKTVSFLKKYLK
jgi:carboxymethylenebutenolidase